MALLIFALFSRRRKLRSGVITTQPALSHREMDAEQSSFLFALHTHRTDIDTSSIHHRRLRRRIISCNMTLAFIIKPMHVWVAFGSSEEE